ncbi:uncharacterized protein FIBRA_07268 [Fibroporia radiculosa]|uniref:RhoGAP-domain-containing protein n=1 Tax=Fibroporia radiculosa TaxID=599839 RepID=J4I0E5_9APHY|nr:uncharacterized protein FIBRA_07268 [Fibroporia radiculosa]CCM05062.1 predicted protein [Fibroporia radiculosa]
MPNISNDPRLDISGSPAADPALLTENRICPGCKKSVVDENGGVVVAFGQSFFHVDCFKCAKCGNQVSADTNLLLLSDGSPICANCSYSCNICKQPILDEAIMTGDDSYHAHCFKCKVCKNRIDELVFAKTSQGIYCMNCHNERVARSRRHAQRQREREKERERERERAAAALPVLADIHKLREDGVLPQQSPRSRNSQSPAPKRLPSEGQSLSERSATGPVSASSTNGMPPTSNASQKGAASIVADRPGHAQMPSITTTRDSSIAPLSISKKSVMIPTTDLPPPSPRAASIDSSSLAVDQAHGVQHPTTRMDSLNVPNMSNGSERPLQTRKSFDGGARPSNFQLRPSPSIYSLNVAGGGSSTSTLGTGGLTVPSGETSRKDKRRSINPVTAHAFSSTLTSPIPDSVSPASVPAEARESPHPSSPRRDYFSNGLTISPPAMADNTEIPNLSRFSSSSSPSTPSSLRGPTPFDSQQVERSRSGSSTAHLPLHVQELEQTPTRPHSAQDRLSSRPVSRAERSNQPSSQSPSPGYSHESARKDHRRLGADGHRPPSLNLPFGNKVLAQKSFDNRVHSTTHSVRPLRNSKSSSTSGPELELPTRASNANTPTSPSHRVDVPHGIESETDTEAESENDAMAEVLEHYHDPPPALPPKDPGTAKSSARPPILRLDTADVSRDSSEMSHIDSEDGHSYSPESSPVERTSHATFIAPALPPIRISMGGTDFSELLKSVGGNVLKLEQLAEATEDGGRKLDFSVISPASFAVSETDSMQPMTPRSAITITDTSDTHVDETPVKGSDDIRSRRMSANINDSLTTLDSVSSTLNEDIFAKFPAVPTTRASWDSNKEGSRRVSNDVSSNPSVIQSPISPQSSVAHQGLSSDTASERRDSLGSLVQSRARITVTSADNNSPETARIDLPESRRQLENQVFFAAEHQSTHVTLEMDLAQTLLRLLDQHQDESSTLRYRLDGMKRTSQQYMDGLTVAQVEYDRELKARRDAEAEVTRLRVLLSGQAVRLSAISADTKRQEAQKQLSQELSNNLSSLGESLSKLKVERDLAFAEVEQLSASKSSSTAVNSEDGAVAVTRALSMRFDNIKSQYQHELLPLTEQREALLREITELKASRDAFLEETTVLNARNEELAQLNAQYVRRLEAAGLDASKHENGSQEESDTTYDKSRHIQNFSSSVTSSTIALTEESGESKFVKVSKTEHIDAPGPQFKPGKFMKWAGHRTPKENVHALWSDNSKPKATRCGGLSCGVQIVASPYTHDHGREDSLPAPPLPPSMFGRDLIEQVRAESKDGPRLIPIIVEKCIEAVDALALDLEGVYRKTGGSGQSKLITQLFERGDYHSFDLLDTERFNDISSVTSVLKSYFRSLPNPLLTYTLHSKFTAAVGIRDPAARHEALISVVNELPKEHYFTARALMLHLSRVSQHSDENLMHARNLGVVFGPTLMRSGDSVTEFGDMGDTTICVEWLIENALTVFEHPPSIDS